jgi:hypothetical protein
MADVEISDEGKAFTEEIWLSCDPLGQIFHLLLVMNQPITGDDRGTKFATM